MDRVLSFGGNLVSAGELIIRELSLDTVGKALLAPFRGWAGVDWKHSSRLVEAPR